MAIEFAGHAHVHDEYSLLDGNANRNQLSYEAVLKGQTHLGLTNHGRISGALEHVHACRHPEKYDNPIDPGKKRSADDRLLPTLGVEAFWRPDRFMDLTNKDLYGKNGHTWAQHLCLHARNLAGWKTLLRLTAKSWVGRDYGGGHYGKPVVDMDMLENDHEGITISSACINSPLAHLILAGDERGAKKWCRSIRDLGIPLWLEVMPHDLDAQRDYNIGLYNIAHDLSEPLMGTGDVHTPYKKWKDTQSLIRMISYRQTISDVEKKRDAGEDVYTEEIDSVYLTSGQEMYDLFRKNHPDLPDRAVKESLANTKDFFSSFNYFTFGKNTKLPKVRKDAVDVVWSWVQEGIDKLKETYPGEHWKRFPWETYEQRIQEEWQVLLDKGVVPYFYIVGDFVRWARSNRPMPVRFGNKVVFPKGKRKRPIFLNLRGSAAGCIISYLIGISSVDPIPHELLFERFLNPDRVGMPDIDIDFESGDDGRDLVIQYLRVIYGAANVASVIAYQTFAPRAVLRAVGTALEVDYKRIDEAADSIGPTERDLQKLVLKNEILAQYRDDFPKAWEQMLRLEDQIKNDSKHASAVIITDKPVTQTGMAVQTDADRRSLITAWADRVGFPIVSEYGWVKHDFLGVNSLNKQHLAVDLIKRFYGKTIDIYSLPVFRDPRAVDPKVMENFRNRKRFDVFQFAGAGIAEALQRINPDDINELSLANAMYRPGAASQIDEFVGRKRGEREYTLWHDAVKPYLGHTYGIIAFQEQVMQVCKAIGGFTGAQADFMRKVVSKLYRLGKEEAQKQMQPFWDIWHEGCRKSGIPEKLIREIWELILEFGGYSFNKAHSTCYALQAYVDMWIKTYYPAAYFAAALTITKKQNRTEQVEFMREGIREARTFDITVLPADINRSEAGWTIEQKGKAIRYGLATVAEVGIAAANSIQNGGPYKSYSEFIKYEADQQVLNKKHVMAMVKAGAFDSADDRHMLLGRIDSLNDHATGYLITLTCGCTANRTVKFSDNQLEEMKRKRRKDPDSLDSESWSEYVNRKLLEKAEEATQNVKCRKHPEAVVDHVDVKDTRVTVAEWIRGHKGDYPSGGWEGAGDETIADAETESLYVNMSSGTVGARYYDFISSCVMSEEEVEKLPNAPKRTKIGGKWKHYEFCSCKECLAAEAMVGGEITRFRVITTQTKKHMAFIDVAHGSAIYNMTLFPDAYNIYKEDLKKQTAWLIKAQKNDRGGLTLLEMADVVEVARDYGWEPPQLNGDSLKRHRGVSLSRLKTDKELVNAR